MKPSLEALPIDESLPAIVAAVRSSRNLVLCSPPGTGKTTRVPRALLDARFAESGEILILEPRRIATRLAAARVAAELGEQVGESVGYTIRFENVAGPATRIRFLTEGILARRIVQDPLLAGVSTVILDEFHERHLTTDLVLAYLRRLQSGRRPDLNMIVMSATLDAAPIAEFLGRSPVLTFEGARFDVTMEYEERAQAQPLPQKIATAAASILKGGIDGDILVFLPGAAEIRQAAKALQPIAARSNLLVLPLHGDLPAAAQARAIQPAGQQKLILATNVAESSVTIPGIAAVIDSGLARVAGHSAWNGLPVLSLAKVSKSSAIQRAGRAGRTQNGRVIRLFTRHDFETRPERDVPEIKRADLAETILTLHGAGIDDLRSFPWFDAPPETALAAAEVLLKRLGALKNDALTETGRQLLRMPVHPRLARLIVEGERLGAAGDGCLAAALIAERDIRLDERSAFGEARSSKPVRAGAPSDLIDLMERFRAAEQACFDPGRVRALGLDPRALDAVGRASRQLLRLCGRDVKPEAAKDPEEAVMIAILSAFPDRVARRRSPAGREFLLSAGGTGRLADSSVVHHAPLIVAVDAGERTGRMGTHDSSGVLIRLASAVEPEWLAGLFPEEIRQTSALLWNESSGRVDEISQTLYGDLALEEVLRPAAPSKAAADLLCNQAMAKGLTLFGDGERVPSLLARVALAAQYLPAAGLQPLGDDQIKAACEACCVGIRNLAALSRTSLTSTLLNSMTPKQRETLLRETPERIMLPRGRKVPVHYESGKMPWIESALQDFLGMKSTPAVCAGMVPLTVHLLAPNRRPVQVTQDLPSFWERHYPALRRQLQRRYPKHFWPTAHDE